MGAARAPPARRPPLRRRTRWRRCFTRCFGAVAARPARLLLMAARKALLLVLRLTFQRPSLSHPCQPAPFFFFPSRRAGVPAQSSGARLPRHGRLPYRCALSAAAASSHAPRALTPIHIPPHSPKHTGAAPRGEDGGARALPLRHHLLQRHRRLHGDLLPAHAARGGGDARPPLHRLRRPHGAARAVQSGAWQ